MSQAVHPPSDLEYLAARLQAGEVVAFPTETVYGLGADAGDSDAVLRIYETKGRPRFNPLIVHCVDLDAVGAIAELSPLAQRLTRFWPGPLTLVLPKKRGARLSDLVTAGLDTVGVRIPRHPLAQALIRAAGVPLAAPSANPSGRLSPTTAAQVDRMFAASVPVLDGGPCEAGVESTIVLIGDGELVQLRAGALPREEIEAVAGMAVKVAETGASVAAPGMLASHYAPRASLRLNAAEPAAGEAFLAFNAAPEANGPMLNLSPTGDLREAARNLFGMLDQLDAGATRIAVAPIPETGLGEAINDRLRRAAAPRPT